jgi:hypothetical protein
VNEIQDTSAKLQVEIDLGDAMETSIQVIFQ